MYLQLIEYYNAEFCFSDGIYGAVFFLSTGFHALHVFVGTIFLFINFIKLRNYQLTFQHHFGLEASL
jgi:heme/copper-type cytochrome/quinol oxidase subunit 3